MRWNRWIAGPALALLVANSMVQAEPDRKPARETASFGLFRQMDVETARTQALAWLRSVGKTDEASLKSFEALWATDKALLEKVTETLQLGDAGAARLLSEAANPETPAPTEVPNLIKDTKLPPFFRGNLGLAYAKALTGRKVYEEALEALKAIRPDNVVDPASYFFHRAVCEHALLMRAEAADSIDRLVNDVVEGPDRYRVVATLMLDDMLAWSDKGLDAIARKMSVIKDRLELTRGGEKTRRMQREVLVKLDEKIKELENQSKGCSACNGGGCPGGGSSGPASGNRPSSPAGDSALPTGSASGDVDIKKIKEVAQVWGTLPEKERAAAMVELTRGMPAKYRDAIESYFKRLGSSGK